MEDTAAFLSLCGALCVYILYALFKMYKIYIINITF